MPLPKFYRVCQDQHGNIVPQVLGSVFNQGTGVLAALYADDAGTIPLSNPMTSDAQYGSFKFYLNPGHFDMTFTKPGYTFEPMYDFQVVEDVLTLGTMAAQDADAVNITDGTAGLTRLNAIEIGAGTTVTPGYVLTAGPGPSLFNGAVGMGVAPMAGHALTTGVLPCRFGGNVRFNNPVGFGVDGQVGYAIYTNALQSYFAGNAQFDQPVGFGVASQPGYAVYTGTLPTYLGGKVGIMVAPAGANALTIAGGNLFVQTDAYKPSGGPWGDSNSSITLKANVRPIVDALARLLALQGRSWEWRPEETALEAQLPGTQTGFVIEEVAEARPEWITDGPDGRPALMIRGFEAMCVEAVRTLLQRIEALEQRVLTLEQA